ncbi:hypothetical protein LXL04_007769 [Taraxacum kok-saghyz]
MPKYPSPNRCQRLQSASASQLSVRISDILMIRNIKIVPIEMFHLIFTLPGKLWSALGIPSDFYDRDTTLFQPLNFPIHDFNWFFHEVSLNCTSSKGMTSDSLDKHFLRFDTWKLLWQFEFISYRTNSSEDLKGSDVAWIEFTTFAKTYHPFQGETFNKTRSPTYNSKGFLLLSA